MMREFGDAKGYQKVSIYSSPKEFRHDKSVLDRSSFGPKDSSLEDDIQLILPSSKRYEGSTSVSSAYSTWRCKPQRQFIKMAARVNIQSLRKTLPAILDLPSVSTGNNVPKSYHKTRRTWHPNVQRIDQPLRILETVNKTRQGSSVLKGVKMTMRHLRTFEKSGGVEGTLLSHTPSGLTPFGKQLRAEVFKRLTAIRDGDSTTSSIFSLGIGQRKV